MLKTLKLLVNRFRPKRETENKLVVPDPATKQNDESLVRSAHTQLVPYGYFDTIENRQRVNDELHASDVANRQRERAYMNKWFNRGELTNSGSFRIAEFERRMDESAYEPDAFIEALPAQEDMLMAFAKPEFDLFEEEKISLSGVFLRVDPNEDFDEHYSVPLLPMYKSNDHVIILDAASSDVEEFNLNFSVDQESSGSYPALKTLVQEIACDDDTLEITLQELIAVPKSMIPAPVPAFIQVPSSSSSVDDARKVRIDPSALFEEWMKEEAFDAAVAPTGATVEVEQPVNETFEAVVSSEVEPETVSIDETIESSEIEKAARISTSTSKSSVKLVSKPNNDEYWSQSDRLTRFGRRKTSASCSSTRLIALPQIA